jgi:hypothetical protein
MYSLALSLVGAIQGSQAVACRILGVEHAGIRGWDDL